MAEDLPPGELQHLQYDFYRVGRTDADFSTTAIHGIDAARFLAGSAYSRIAFHYRELPELGPTTANILLDCTFVSGVTAQICFLPVSGAVIERATLHALDRIYFLRLPSGMPLTFRAVWSRSSKARSPARSAVRRPPEAPKTSF